MAKKIIFSDEAHFDLGGYLNKQSCRIWGAENPHAYIDKPTHSKRVTVWYGFRSRGIIEPFFFENGQGKVVTVTGDHFRATLKEFLFTKIEEDDIGNRTALRATRPKPYSMSWALFFKIALSAAELLSFGHLGAAILHRWTIICLVPSKISVTPIGQRQLKI